MISDEPDEDADTLDDENLLQKYLGAAPLKQEPADDRGMDVLDWPSSREHGLGPELDAGTLAWFKANHVDWRREMWGVLRAWVAVRKRKSVDHKADAST